MSIRVYHADSNPAVDHFSFRQSNKRGDDIVARGEGQFILLRDGRRAIQLFRRRAEREQWLARLEPQSGSQCISLGAGRLKYIPHQSEIWLRTQRESLIVNVRALRGVIEVALRKKVSGATIAEVRAS